MIIVEDPLLEHQTSFYTLFTSVHAFSYFTIGYTHASRAVHAPSYT